MCLSYIYVGLLRCDEGIHDPCLLEVWFAEGICLSDAEGGIMHKQLGGVAWTVDSRYCTPAKVPKPHGRVHCARDRDRSRGRGRGGRGVGASCNWSRGSSRRGHRRWSWHRDDQRGYVCRWMGRGLVCRA